MRLAFFSPMPPAKTGIADYAEALVAELKQLADVTVFDGSRAAFRPEQFDLALYQLGNNPYHVFVYRHALAYPGVVVMHEPNLHHLIAELTIKQGDWDTYLSEVEYNGGAEALAYAKRVEALEVGPDYQGLPMMRRLLERSRAVIVHTNYAAEQVRRQGFEGPVARIPHGAWIPPADRWAYRHRLGVDESTPLIGIFGFLKPYKRIAESLRAFQRLLRVEPRAKMILVGEPHPDLPLGPLIRALDLSASVRLLGFVVGEDFTGYMAACDIILNLRYPTVGEISGTLLRALGLGKCALVSDVGSFRELPDDVCLKVPVDASEEDILFEYLSLMVSRPSLARKLGMRAKQWVEAECNWERVARLYASFLQSVIDGMEWRETEQASKSAQESKAPPASLPDEGRSSPALEDLSLEIGSYTEQSPSKDSLLLWAPPEPGARNYMAAHLSRLTKTLAITPRGGPSDRVLEMGSYLQITPLLKTQLGYGEVRGCYYGPAGQVVRKNARSLNGETFECELDLFDAERDVFPYADGYFSTVLCCEVLEHLTSDPMHMMSEINRVLKPSGYLVLTTPNLSSLRGISAILQGYHPGFFPAYIRRSGDDSVEARHNREYTPIEIHLLLRDAGFEVVLLETGPFIEEPKPELGWVEHLLDTYKLRTDLRGDGIYAIGRKCGSVRNRYPGWLYSGPEQ